MVAPLSNPARLGQHGGRQNMGRMREHADRMVEQGQLARPHRIHPEGDGFAEEPDWTGALQSAPAAPGLCTADAWLCLTIFMGCVGLPMMIGTCAL